MFCPLALIIEGTTEKVYFAKKGRNIDIWLNAGKEPPHVWPAFSFSHFSLENLETQPAWKRRLIDEHPTPHRTPPRTVLSLHCPVL